MESNCPRHSWRETWLRRSQLIVRSAAYISARLKGLHQFTLTLPPVQQRPMDWVQDEGTKTHSTYYTLPSVPYNTLFLNPVASKQA